MKIITMNLENPSIQGKFLAQNAYHKWDEEFIDQDTGEVVSIQRKETIARRGACLNAITISLLKENDISEVETTDEQRLGSWANNYAKWEVFANVPRTISGSTKCVTEAYLIFTRSAAEAEELIVDELEKSCNGDFKITKIQLSKIEEIIYSDGNLWFRAVIKYTDCDGKNTKMNILIRAVDLDTAVAILQSDNTLPYKFTLSEIKDTNFMEVFNPKNGK